jgi:alkylation response protein AidB-like acyl-CoA dehydrogenase
VRDLNIELEPKQDAFRQEFRTWLAEHVPTDPLPDDQDEMFAFQREWHRTLHRDGWAAIDWPVEHGGRGASHVEKFVYYEELSRAGAPRLLNQPSLILVGPTMMVHSPPEQQQRFLPGILSADDVWCQGFSEPDAGSDLAGLRTRARLDGDQWVINGQKTWTTWAMYSDWCALLCRTSDAPRHKGLSMLIVDMHQPGVQVRPIDMMTGRQEFGEVYFDDAVAPRDAVIGEPGQGWAVAMTMLDFERSDQSPNDHARLYPMLLGAARLLGRARLQGAARAIARDRLAELWSRYQVMRSFNLHSARRLDAGEPVGSHGSVLKLYWSELYQDIGALAADVLGVDAADDNTWNELYLEGRAATIYAGTSEIQRTIIGERLAGLPRVTS